MRIQIETPDGPRVELHVGVSGGATVRIDGSVVGTCRWEKDGNTMRFYSLPLTTFRSEDEDEGERLTFEFDHT